MVDRNGNKNPKATVIKGHKPRKASYSPPRSPPKKMSSRPLFGVWKRPKYLHSESPTEQNEKLWQVEATRREQQIKLQQLEEMVAVQRVELQRADKFVEWQKAELQRAKELIESQKAELRVADEETANQLQKQQCTFAVLKQQELALKESKELSESRKEQVVKLKGQIAVLLKRLPQVEEKLLTERSNNSALQEQVVLLQDQLQVLLDDNERLWQELETLELQSVRDRFNQAKLQIMPIEQSQETRSEGSLQNEAHSAIVNTNERNISEYSWLISECSQLKEMLRNLDSEHHSLVQRTDSEKEMMRKEIDRLIEEGLRKDEEVDMMESSLEELGKVKNHEINDLKQAMRRLQESSASLKEELESKEEEIRMLLAVTKRPRNKWFGGRQH